ncbi:hypothetical protein MVEN_02411500 [Mycena venus]|uniref:Uncharacterized protein n=1 Tax=Mycena venus TaxID=2733690 RepID=A0A8H6X2V4_9AGAR|nr:hypothetical protein MVEN_02411500 [Mycena venus]
MTSNIYLNGPYNICRSNISIFDGGSEVLDFTLTTTLREVGALWLLPMAYYDACMHGPEGLQSALDKGADEAEVHNC